MDIITLTAETNKGKVLSCDIDSIFKLDDGEFIESITIE